MPQFDNAAPSNLHIVLTSSSEWIPTPGRAKARGARIVESLRGHRKIQFLGPANYSTATYSRTILSR